MAASRKTESPSQALKDLWPGQSVELLMALHILTRDGALNADSRRKLKQVLHLVQLLQPSLDAIFAAKETPVLADLGAGKSYLAFILYDLAFGPKGRGDILAIESRQELAAGARTLAAQAHFDRMQFIAAPIAAANVERGVDMVTALHACDTATDDAIKFALKHQAKHIALVPCCQAELAQLLSGTGSHELHQLWRHPIQRRGIASHLTNVIRGLYLEAHGYKVRVTELVGFEHSMKNELIIAERHQLSNAHARGELATLLKRLPARPALVADI